MHRSRMIAAILGGILVVSACTTSSGGSTANPSTSAGGGGGSATTAPASSPGGSGNGTLRAPCSLLTQAQVAAVVGYAVAAGTDADNPGHSCTWTYQDAQDFLTSVAVTVDVNINPDTFTKICSAPSNSTLGITVTQLSGVGDAACQVTLSGSLGATNTTFQKDSQGYGTAIIATGKLKATFDPATQAAMEKTLALEVVANL